MVRDELSKGARSFLLDAALVTAAASARVVIESLRGNVLAGSDLGAIKGFVQDSGEGRWTILEAMSHDVPATSLAHALFSRFTSRQDDSFAMKVAAALRNQFGGHAVRTERSRDQFGGHAVKKEP